MHVKTNNVTADQGATPMFVHYVIDFGTNPTEFIHCESEYDASIWRQLSPNESVWAIPGTLDPTEG